MTRVLIAYGSKHGATAGIAQRIGEVLAAHGLAVTLRGADQVGELGPYEAVVLGSAVYAGHWRPEAVALLQAQAEALSARPVWLFSSGPTGTGDPVERLDGWRFPEEQQPTADRIRPREIRLFHGKIDLDALSIGERLVVRALGAPTGDYRDWPAITAWAEGIAAALSPAAAAGQRPAG